MFEHRREARNACYLRAEIILETGAPPIIAEAHDISDSGMRLKVLNSRTLPNRFLLSIPRRHFREYVEIKRRSEGEVGVVIHKISVPKTGINSR